MNDAQMDEAAALLAAAREEITRLDSLPVHARPQSAGEMYAIQDKLVTRLGKRGGFKAGPASPQMKPVEGMICAALPEKNIVPSGARLRVPSDGFVATETEIAFRLGKSLPAQEKDYSESEIIAAIAEAIPVIEVVWSRFSDMAKAGVHSLIADSQMHGALVVGAPIPDWKKKNLDTPAVQVSVNGKEAFNKNQARHPAGRPLASLIWLANEGARRRGGLQKGDIITCGSFSGVTPITAPADVAAGFPGLTDNVTVSLFAS
jgi:2-keto-4-pentenoate hydratase